MSTARPWKTAWIVGASTGLGRAAAISLAEDGVRVAASARDETALRSLAEDSGGRITAFPLDVTRPADVDAAAADIEQAFGHIDLAVFAAGVWEPFDIDRFDPDAFRAGIGVNYLGTVNAVAAVLPAMRARAGGQIAIVASVAGYVGLPQAATYAPTKAALINLGECLRTELDGSGVTVSVVNPGFIETRLTAKNSFPMPFIMSPEDAAERMISGLATGRFEVTYPRRFTWMLKLVRMLPYPVLLWGIRKLVRRR